MVLDKSNKKLQIVLAGAKATLDCPVHVSFEDVKRDAVWPPQSVESVTNGVTIVDICPAPDDSVSRNITEIVVYNRDTAAITLFIQKDIGGIVYELKKFALNPGQSMTYKQDYVWTVN